MSSDEPSSSSDASAAPSAADAAAAPSAADAANEAIIADLLSPQHAAEHIPVTSASTESILAAADKPQQPKPDSFYSEGLPDLAPQALSPVGAAADQTNNSHSFTFKADKANK